MLVELGRLADILKRILFHVNAGRQKEHSKERGAVGPFH
jgi:hypothetical protein